MVGVSTASMNTATAIPAKLIRLVVQERFFLRFKKKLKQTTDQTGRSGGRNSHYDCGQSSHGCCNKLSPPTFPSLKGSMSM